MIGPILTLVALIDPLPPARRRYVLVLAAGAVAACCLLTFQRNRLWRDPVALWEDNVRRAPGRARAHGHLGKAYMDRGRHAEAQRAFTTMLEIDPTFSTAYVNLAILAMEGGDTVRAEAYLAHANIIFPANPGIYMNRGVIRLNANLSNPTLSGLRLALGDFEKTLDLDPHHPGGFANMGACHINIGDLHRREARALRTAQRPADVALHNEQARAAYREAERVLRQGRSIWPENMRFDKLLDALAGRIAAHDAESRLPDAD